MLPALAQSRPFVRVRRVAGDAAASFEAFGKVHIEAADDVSDVAARACAAFGWGAAPAHLYLAAAGGVDEPTAAVQRDALAGARLQGGWPLARAGVASGAWLLAATGAAAAAAAAAPTPLEVFFEALGAASHDATARSLTLAPDAGAVWGGAAGGGRVLFVRECYAALDAAVAASRFALVRGTPGVGKSMFALFHVWRALQRGGGGAVVYDYAVETTRKLRVILEGGAARSVKPRLIERLLHVPSTLYVADGTAPSESSCRTLVVTSPKRDVWKNWAKVTPVEKFFVPPFDAAEMERCRALCFPALNAAAVARAFDIWGGSARLVLLQHVEAAAPAFQREAAAALTFDALASVVHDLAAAGSASDDTPQRVVHMVPADDLRSFCLRFASPHMRDLFYDLMQLAGAARVREFVAAAEASPAMAPLRGQLFERLALAALCRAGTLQIFALGDSARSAPAPETLFDRSMILFRDVDEAAGSVRRCQGAGETPPLCRPRAANFPTWDAAAIDDGRRLTLYQATVGSEHDVKAEGLALAEPLGALSTGPVRFVFVVPPRGGPCKAAPLPHLPAWLASRGLEQFTLEVDLA
jgi:hypothetical protein